MRYVLVRYRHRPEDVIDEAATSDPAEAVELVRRWSRSAPDEGLILAVAGHAVVHCMPRGA